MVVLTKAEAAAALPVPWLSAAQTLDASVAVARLTESYAREAAAKVPSAYQASVYLLCLARRLQSCCHELPRWTKPWLVSTPATMSEWTLQGLLRHHAAQHQVL